MNVFIEFLKTLQDSGVELAEARIHSTPQGPAGRRILIRVANHADVEALEHLAGGFGLREHIGPDGLTLIADVNDD